MYDDWDFQNVSRWCTAYASCMLHTLSVYHFTWEVCSSCGWRLHIVFMAAVSHLLGMAWCSGNGCWCFPVCCVVLM